MKIGLMHVTPNSRPSAIVAKRAEDLGFESYWVGDHTIIPVKSTVKYGGGSKADGSEPDYLWQLPDPLVALARAGATTTRIMLGTGITLVPERNPILTAKQIATLDDACGGRFLFGIGALESRGIEDSGRDFEHRWSQVKDYIAAMKVLWRDDSPSITDAISISRRFDAIRSLPGNRILPS